MFGYLQVSASRPRTGVGRWSSSVQDKTIKTDERAIKRSVKVGDRSVSVSLEDAFWEAFRDLARLDGLTNGELLVTISSDLQAGGLSSAVRVYILRRFRALAEARSKMIG